MTDNNLILQKDVLGEIDDHMSDLQRTSDKVRAVGLTTSADVFTHMRNDLAILRDRIAQLPVRGQA